MKNLMIGMFLSLAVLACDPPEATQQEEKKTTEPAAEEQAAAQSESEAEEAGEEERAGESEAVAEDSQTTRKDSQTTRKYPGACVERTTVNEERKKLVTLDYDARGAQITRTLMGLDGKVQRRTVMTWEDDDRPLSEITYGPEGEELASLRYEYDENGHQVALESKSGEVHEKTVTTREDGKVVKEVVTRLNDGTTSGISTWEYDDQDRKVKRSFDSGGTGNVDAVTAWKWKDGNPVAEVELDDDGKPFRSSSREYDDEGRLIKETERYGERLNKVTTWTWGPHGKRAEQVDRRGDGTVDDKTTWEWDEHGNLLRRTRESQPEKDGRVEVTTYDYSCW